MIPFSRFSGFDEANFDASVAHVFFGVLQTRFDMSKMKGGVSALPVACPSFGAAREAGELDGNLGRMPVVVIDGQHTLGQSKSIERCVVVHEH